MRGGRIFIVDSDSYEATKKFNIAAIGKKDLNLGKNYIKTIYDLMSDILTLNKGDLIFFWEKSNNRTGESGRGLIGVYEVISDAYYDTTPKIINSNVYLGENYPFRIDIREIISFNKYLSEYYLFSRPDVRSKVWNLVGKKVGGKARGSIPLTPLECEILIHLLSEINGGITLISQNAPMTNLNHNNYLDVKLNIGLNNVNNYKNIPMLNKIDFSKIPTVDDTNKNPEKYKVTQEKVLEAWLSNNIRSSINLENLFGPKEYIGWYSSYLPYSLDQKEIDFMVFHNHPKHNFLMRISLVELKKDTIKKDAVDQVFNYFKWAELNLVPGTKSIIQPIIIGKKPSSKKLDELKKYVEKIEKENNLIRGIWLVNYKIDMEKNDIIFENLNFEYPDFL